MQDGRVEGSELIICKNTKIATNFQRTIHKSILDPTKKTHAPCPRAKEKSKQDGKRGTIAFKIKPHTHQRCLEGINKTLCALGRKERSSDSHKRLNQNCLWVFECLLLRHESTVGCLGDRASATEVLGGTTCGRSPLEGGHH